MKRKYFIIGMAVLATAGLLYFIFGKESSGPSDDASTGEKEKMSQLHSIFQFMSSDKDSKPVQEFNPDNVKTYEIKEANLIRDVIVEKNPVCVNEEFMVRVVAKNPNGPDEHLVYRIQNKLGNPAILRFTKAGPKEFYVIVRDEGLHIDFRKVQVNVLDCPGRSSVILQGHLHNLKSETARFEVTSQEGLAGKCSYQWNFGDKKKTTTHTGYVEHSYATRDQKSLQSSFLVTVKVTDSQNQTATGRTTISFPNIHYLSRLMGSAVLPVVYDQFPKVTDNGIEVTATFKNIFDEPLTFNTAELEIKPCNGSWSAGSRQLPASSILSVATIPPGESVQQVLYITKSQMASSTCNVNVNLKGYFPGNEEGSAKLYLSLPPRSREDVDPNKDKVIEDTDMVRKLNKARQIMGKDKPITPADIEKLDREGKL
jgi:hypothetical protein